VLVFVYSNQPTFLDIFVAAAAAPETIPYPITKDNTGCPPLQIPEGHPHPSMNESWIALVMRGGCGFDEKVFTTILIVCQLSSSADL
jgi:hypothetical protein